jgi:hypothetical protein
MNRILFVWTALLITPILGIGCGTDEREGPAGPIDGGDTPTNHPPVICDQPDTAARVGDTLILFACAEDEDGDSLMYGMSNILYWWLQPNEALTDFDAVTGEFRFYVRMTDFPLQMFEFYVVDIECNSDTTFFIVRVSK